MVLYSLTCNVMRRTSGQKIFIPCLCKQTLHFWNDFVFFFEEYLDIILFPVLQNIYMLTCLCEISHMTFVYLRIHYVCSWIDKNCVSSRMATSKTLPHHLLYWVCVEHWSTYTVVRILFYLSLRTGVHWARWTVVPRTLPMGCLISLLYRICMIC